MAAAAGSVPTTMKAACITKYGDLKDAEQFAEIATIPAPAASALGANEILVKAVGVSINPIDFKIAKGYFAQHIPLKFPAPLGFDVSGVVVAVGANCKRLKAGDKVIADVGGPKSFAEYVVMAENQAALAPKSVSLAHAAAIPLAGLTAFQALHTHGLMKKGDRVLILGGSGGVGHIAIGIAKSAGAFVATTTSAKNSDFVKSLGADAVHDYTKANWGDEVKGNTFNIIFETAPSEHHLSIAKNALVKGGIMVSIVAQPPADAQGVNFKFMMTDTKPDREVWRELDAIVALVDSQAVKLTIAKTFHFTKNGFVELLHDSHAGRTRGKLVMQISNE